VPWPRNDTKYLSHFPETREIYSYGSGGNALVSTKSHTLAHGVRSSPATRAGWPSTCSSSNSPPPSTACTYLAAAFPSWCGKTTLAMLEPTLPGWTIDTLATTSPGCASARTAASTRATTRPGCPRRPGRPTGPPTPTPCAPSKAATRCSTNTGLTDDGDIWWKPWTTHRNTSPPGTGQDWHPYSDEPSTHPNARYTTPITQCPTLAPEWNDPAGATDLGHPVRRPPRHHHPLVTQARDWPHGVFLAATLASETTTPISGSPVGERAATPWPCDRSSATTSPITCGIGSISAPAPIPPYYPKSSWSTGSAAAPDSQYLWPGYRDNARILTWIIERVEGTATAFDTPIGWIPTASSLDLAGLDTQRTPIVNIQAALAVDRDEWRAELPRLRKWFTTIGDTLPAALHQELDRLTDRITQPSDR